MTTIYVKHECKTLEELNALALTDGQENDSLVISPTGELAWWYEPYVERNDPPTEGRWSYQDGYGGDHIHFPLSEGQTVTVLVGEEAGPESFETETGTWTRYATAWVNA